MHWRPIQPTRIDSSARFCAIIIVSFCHHPQGISWTPPIESIGKEG